MNSTHDLHIMSRNALLSRNGQPGAASPSISTQPVPSIRFISATPSAHDHHDPQNDNNINAYPLPLNLIAPFTATTLAPRADATLSPRKRLVPKKSKLSLLAAGAKSLGKDKLKSKSKADDLSDVVRRVGAGPSPGGFEIYVDHCDDAEDASIVMVKKKKSRAALDNVGWGQGALGEVTNAGHVPALPSQAKPARLASLKVPSKSDENQNSKWWNVSIGRGRKGKENGSVRSKTPEPFGNVSTEPEPTARFKSLDSGRLLGVSSFMTAPEVPPQAPSNDVPAPSQTQRPRGSTLSSLSTMFTASETDHSAEGYLAPPTPVEQGPGQGSIALRAMKSMRSMARMKSWANLGSDKSADTKEGNDTVTKARTKLAATATIKTKKKSKEKEGKTKKKEEKDKDRISTSSFEAGALSSLPQSTPPPDAHAINKKPSKLALGGLLPSTVRLGTVRPMGSRFSSISSTASRLPVVTPAPTTTLYGLPNNRLSADSTAHLVMGANGRPASAFSACTAGSSLRPPSTSSGMSVASRTSSGMSASAFSTRSGRSSSSSVGSVRWDEDGLAGVKERQRRERELRQGERRNDLTAQESTRGAEGKRRIAIMEIFPEVQPAAQAKKTSVDTVARQPPIVTVEEATIDDRSGCESGASTPLKRVRARPASEQLLNMRRPKAFSDDTGVVLSILDQATNDLASLINRLDLEATPATIKGSPIQPLRSSPSTASLGRAWEDSPLKGRKAAFSRARAAPLFPENRESIASIASLRTFAQTQLKSHPAVPATRQQPMDPLEVRRGLIGQRIAPWSELNWHVSPKKPARPSQTFRPSHRRVITPTPEADLGPVFQPLRPAAPGRVTPVETAPSASATPVPVQARSVPSSQTFGSSSRAPKVGRALSSDLGFDDAAPPSPTPRARRGHSRRQSVLSVMCDTGVALPLEAVKSLGLGGTLGGPEPEINPHEPGSDIPDELKSILSGQSDDESAQAFEDMFDVQPRSRPPSPGLPPLSALPIVCPDTTGAERERDGAPVFRATLCDADVSESDVDEGEGSVSEDDTKKSFDFTGELRRLTESGASDRRSFVEQVENAFRTPARVELDFSLGAGLFLPPDGSPATALTHRETPDRDLVPHSVADSDLCGLALEASVEQSAEQQADQSVDDSAEPSFRDSATSDTLDRLLAECEQDLCGQYSDLRRCGSSMRSKASDGQLNTSFRFGGRPAIPAPVDEIEEDKPLTLSDIIPPFTSSRPSSVAGSSMLGDDSLIKSILGNIHQEDTSVLNSIIAHAQAAAPRSRVSSTTSSRRPSRYSADISRASSHSRNNSELSFQGFESFEEVRRGFEFHPNRPAFYPPPGALSREGHNKHESFYSVASVSSYGVAVNSGASDPFGYGPSRPGSFSDDTSMSMSLTVDDTFSFLKKDVRRKRVDSEESGFYFRPSARRGHRHIDSSFSVASAVPPISLYNRSFGVHRRNDSGASSGSAAVHGGRSSWARDSMFSEYSPINLARPGLGDKMFEMMDYGMPLSAIAASPTASVFSEQQEAGAPFSPQTTSSDSIFGAEPKTGAEDSIFEKTGQKMSCGPSDDVFEFDLSRPEQESYVRLHQFRPISMMSMASVHSVAGEEDTMITMLGGGHVRRRSIDSRIDGSPCAPLERERKKHTALQHLARVLRFDQGDDELPASVPDRVSKISPVKTVVTKPSIASTSSYLFESEKMIVAGKGLLERPSLKEGALLAQGQDLLSTFENCRVFSGPTHTSRSRSSTVTSASSGIETPPLSASDNSSVSSGSQYSIDIGHLDKLLTGAAHPTGGAEIARAARARARGTGHRRRISQARASRSSVYETIQEESGVLTSEPSRENLPASAHAERTISQPQNDTVYIVDPDTTTRSGDWNSESGVLTLRKYYALREEAGETVTESKKVWVDTPFSVFAMQSFQPPANRSGMTAMLEQSQKTYGPLPSDLQPHRVRSRTSSRASPYPVRSRCASNEQPVYSFSARKPFASPDSNEKSSSTMRSISINPNISNPNLTGPDTSNPSVKVFFAPPAAKPNPAFSVHVDVEEPKEKPLPQVLRPRVTSSARRSALGWSKRNTGKSTIGKSSAAKASTASEKENSIGQGIMLTPNDTLRISRPRPKGRTSLARTALAN
ncbi:hypothetical protein PHLGIDRAFT_128997 [Phlebiopsis gigantea 11061_1 CR5-6]|uniref:Uncharacterized protein n=1 Tax=Phlebiopsis gigantea (strain 11061_1 CR5-6) TaxID=745531 RepID=A0A0C3S8E2_PHLG1|nr:hypothetical protein PHLGIDRAFT_128997 [Phlebiopsis gigantea 11061_1 CR5-6]